MFINLSNHPSAGWGKEQLEAARQYGEIVDMPFPSVNEQATETEIVRLASEYLNTIMSKGAAQDLTVHIMGEQTFCYALISKLQKEGIRCVASCTEHDTFINEQGQKVSTFHFARFREYRPPRALRWWIKAKNTIASHLSNPFRQKSFYSWSALSLVLICEISIVVFLQTGCTFAKWAALAYGFLLLLALYILSRIVGIRFSLSGVIVSKLLANAIAPTTLGTFYLLTFVTHIGWITNTVLGLYTESGDDFCKVLFSFIVCFLGSLAVILFFPDGRENKNDNAKLVFVTGISSFQGVPKDNTGKKVPAYETFNMRPLIRILQVVTQQRNYKQLRGEFLILQTANLASAVPTPYFVGSEQYGFDNIDAKECAKYGITPENSINDKLRLIIKKLAIKEFSMLEEWVINNLDIRFTSHCNYNDFPVCFETLSKEVQALDNPSHRLIFNTTPGTAVVSTVMTLLSIDADRELYYYSQDSNIPEDRIVERLQKANKQGVELEDLLSQALEKMANSY